MGSARSSHGSRCRLALGVLLAWPLLAAATVDRLHEGVNLGVRFDAYSPLARTRELFARSLNPLGERRALARYAQRRLEVPEYTVDLAEEEFAVFVPKAPPPPQGYGLLVYVAPWQQATVPRRWQGVFERTGIIYVSAARSGNPEPELPRRMALALHGYGNIVARYHIDAERVYVGGFSGGARIAEVLALAYPDVFHGAVLDGSSDRIGTPLALLPPPHLLELAQQRLRLVYVYGADDSYNAAQARYSMQSAATWCLPPTYRLVMAGRGHEPADAPTLLRALRLQEPAHEPAPPAATCRARHARQLHDEVAAVDAMLAAGERDAASTALRALDAAWAQSAGDDIRRLADALHYQ